MLLRFAFIQEISWIKYSYILHAHSHVAMMGWIHMALYIILVQKFLSASLADSFYKWMLVGTQSSVVGMMISFPLTGYGPVSISFATLHILIAFLFTYRFFRDLSVKSDRKYSSIIFVKTSLGFMILSSAAIFFIPVIISSGMRQSALYYGAIQFFLHFQFNGWYIFSFLAIFLRYVETKTSLPNLLVRRFYYLLVTSCLLTFALAITWSNPSAILFWINSAGVILQMMALIYFVLILRKIKKVIFKGESIWFSYLLSISFISFCLKIIVQTAVVVPYIGTIGYTIRNFVIGFIHLILLAAMSTGILSFAIKSKWLDTTKSTVKFGIGLMITGILLTELLLFIQGTMLWANSGFMPYYYELIFVWSILIPAGVLCLIISDFRFKIMPNDHVKARTE